MRRGAVGAVLLAALVLPAGAGAHGETSPTIQTVVDGLEPEVGGLAVRVLPGPAARLAATNETGEPLTVLGSDGKPMLRIGPGGVEANVNSLDWYRSGNPDGAADLPPGADIGARPRFVRVLRRSSYAWFDHRMHPGTVRVPDQALRSQRDARLDDWEVPMRLGRRALRVSGHVEYRPLLGTVSTRLLGPASPLPGVQTTVLQGPIPGFVLVNSGPRPVTIVGSDGRPFARVGSGGVRVNVRSPTHAASQAANGRPVTATGGAPRWRTVSRANSLSWLDERTVYARGQPPKRVAASGRRAALRRFSIPIEQAGRRVELRGETYWQPYRAAARKPAGSIGGEAVIAGGLALVLGLGAALRLRVSRLARRGRTGA